MSEAMAAEPPRPAAGLKPDGVTLLGYVLDLSKATGRDRIPIRKQRTVIGKGKNCDVIVQERPLCDFISKEHATLKFEEGRFYLEDLASKNGTKLASKSLQPGSPAELTDGATFSLYTVPFQVEYAAVPPAAPGDTAPVAIPRLEVPDDPVAKDLHSILCALPVTRPVGGAQEAMPDYVKLNLATVLADRALSMILLRLFRAGKPVRPQGPWLAVQEGAVGLLDVVRTNECEFWISAFAFDRLDALPLVEIPLESAEGEKVQQSTAKERLPYVVVLSSSGSPLGDAHPDH